MGAKISHRTPNRAVRLPEGPRPISLLTRAKHRCLNTEGWRESASFGSVWRDEMRRAGLAVACLFLVAACGPGGGGGTQSVTPKHGGTATIALESELRTLDPLDSSLLVEREVFYNMYDSLFTIDPSLSIKPGLVKSWDTSDPMNYKFTLQSGVKYQDGTPFNALSVKDNITRYKTTASSRRKSDLASVSSVEAVDDIHVTFHLKKPDATLLATLVDRAGMMLSMAAVQKGGQAFSLA